MMQATLSKLTALLLFFSLSACTLDTLGTTPAAAPPPSLGDFKLEHNVVVAKDARKIGPSLEVAPASWEARLEAAIDERFGGYLGEKLYHIGINLDGYALAEPEVPVATAPRPALVVSVTIWDDAAQEKLNEPPRQMMIFADQKGGALFGPARTSSREEQMAGLAEQLALAVERYLVANGSWFGVDTAPQAIAASDADLLKAPEANTAAIPSGEIVATPLAGAAN
ncbi:MAG: hypothetical protein JXR14_12825 [Paracoccaceae bacterium]